jgi:L-alanine-DL-glutamate epimerase-like enolase superfamily enzyme
MAGLQYADLDGHMDLASDPSSGGFEVVNGCLVLSNRPGLGTEIDW